MSVMEFIGEVILAVALGVAVIWLAMRLVRASDRHRTRRLLERWRALGWSEAEIEAHIKDCYYWRSYRRCRD